MRTRGPTAIRQDPPTGASTWRATFLGSMLFLLTGLFLMLNEIPHTWSLPDWLLPIQGLILILLLVLPALGFSIGWILGFPHWTYPYTGFLLRFSFYWMNVATPGLRIFGYTFGRSDLWGWRAWIPGLVMLALLISRSLRPGVMLVAQLEHDATLWTWTLFGFLPFLAGIGFDEMDRLYSLPYMALITLVAMGTALVYLRSPHPLVRVGALVAGAIALIAIVVVAPTLYWQPRSGVDGLGAVKAGAVLLAVLFAPAAAIGLLRRTARSVPA